MDGDFAVEARVVHAEDPARDGDAAHLEDVARDDFAAGEAEPHLAERAPAGGAVRRCRCHEDPRSIFPKFIRRSSGAGVTENLIRGRGRAALGWPQGFPYLRRTP